MGLSLGGIIVLALVVGVVVIAAKVRNHSQKLQALEQEMLSKK